MNGKLTPAWAVIIYCLVSTALTSEEYVAYRIDNHGSQPLDEYNKKQLDVPATYCEYTERRKYC